MKIRLLVRVPDNTTKGRPRYAQLSKAYDLDDEFDLNLAKAKYKEMLTPAHEKDNPFVVFVEPVTGDEVGALDAGYDEIKAQLV